MISGTTLAKQLSDELICGRKGFLLLFHPAVFLKGIELVEGIDRFSPGVRMLGGGAASLMGNQVDKTNLCYVLVDDIVSDNGLVAAFVSSERLWIYENYVCGAENVGKSYELSEVDSTVLMKVDGKHGAEWYADLLGKEELAQNPHLSNVFPIIKETDIKTPYFVNYETAKDGKKDKLTLLCELEKGTKISLGYFNPQRMLDEMRTVYKEIKTAPTEAIFAYDCQGRVNILKNCAKWEVEQFYTTNVSGALLEGEIVHNGQKNIYSNYTFILACIAEHENAHISLRSRDLRNVSRLQQDNMQIVNYLLTSENRELSKQLQSQQATFREAMFYNAALDLNNQLSYLHDRESKNWNKIALYCLSNERMVKLFVGRKEIFDELKKIYHDIGNKIRTGTMKQYENSICLYSYETSSLLIAADEKVNSIDFADMTASILNELNDTLLGNVRLSYQCAVVENEDDLLHKVETALQYGIARNIAYVRYEDIARNIIDAKEEIHMLQVLRDVLDEEMIVPYFQGIYDNHNNEFGLYESLMRIKDKKGKIYYPNQFLPIAKEYNLYESLSLIMVKKVMEMFLDKNIKVSINLSVRDIYDREIIKVIFQNLDRAQYPENFVFELVETEEITDYQYIKEFADLVHEKGAKIAIDDFGSGFSNLMHIMRIDADYLKIDGEIIRMVSKDEKSREFVDVINYWCKRQQKQMIAEFVEDDSIQKIVDEMGIAYSQGYYFSKPGPWEEEE